MKDSSGNKFSWLPTEEETMNSLFPEHSKAGVPAPKNTEAVNAEDVQKMDTPSTWLPSEEEALKSLYPDGKIPTSLSAIDITPGEEPALSPFAEGKNAEIMERARERAMDFAHPVDGKVIQALDNPTTTAIIGKVVQASIDAGEGLTLASGVHVSEQNFPGLYQILKECAETLGIPVPYMIISDSVPGINARTSGTDQFAYIAVSPFVPYVMKPEEIKFVIGHECGHLALGHVVYHVAASLLGTAVGTVGSALPIVGPLMNAAISLPLKAWSRRSEISADRAGLLCCGSPEAATAALFKLNIGVLAARMDECDIDRYVAESEQILNSSSLGYLGEYNLAHPIIPKRIMAIRHFAASECYQRCSGNVLNGRLLNDQQLYEKTEEIIGVVK